MALRPNHPPPYKNANYPLMTVLSLFPVRSAGTVHTAIAKQTIHCANVSCHHEAIVIRRAAIFLVAIGGIADIGRVLARDGLSAFDPWRRFATIN